MFDENKDGTIDTKELRNMMAQFNQNVTDEELKQIMSTADVDGESLLLLLLLLLLPLLLLLLLFVCACICCYSFERVFEYVSINA